MASKGLVFRGTLEPNKIQHCFVIISGTRFTDVRLEDPGYILSVLVAEWSERLTTGIEDPGYILSVLVTEWSGRLTTGLEDPGYNLLIHILSLKDYSLTGNSCSRAFSGAGFRVRIPAECTRDNFPISSN
uniref:Uncharacterized protein n=1 Tax=Timema douglasi TaxID=61478 RepID=A0A7R8Z9V3_TIMDO|nr:unnamed protein product [Timema douglasi]